MESSGFNDQHDVTVKNFLLPSLVELAWLFTVSLILLVLLNFRLIWDLVISNSGANQQATEPFLESIAQFFAQQTFGKVAVYVFWGLVGCVSYAIVWSLQHFASRIKEDVDTSGYVQPNNAKGYWSSRLSSYIFLATISFTFLAALLVWFTALLPHAVHLASIPLQDLSRVSGYKNIVFAVLITMLSVYILSRLWKAVAYSFRLNFSQK